MSNWLRLDEIKKEVFNTYNELFDKVSRMSFDKAFNELNGFNLSAEPFYDEKEEKVLVELKFEVKYGNIETTIFKTCDNECEVWETCAYMLEEERDKGEIVFDIGAHRGMKLYSIITNGKVIVIDEKWEKMEENN